MSIRKKYFDILLYLAEKSSSPSFAPLHHQVRNFYALSVPTCTKIGINGFSKNRRSQVFLRGSTKSSEGFNVFLSDLDLEILIPHEDENHITEIRQKINRLKKVFPALGEAEIYTVDEKKKYNELLEDGEEIYSFLRKVRKTVWMKRALDTALTDYHKMKANRSRELCYKALRGDLRYDASLSSLISKFLKSWFPTVIVSGVDSYHGIFADDQYMGMRIFLQSPSENDETLSSHQVDLPLPENEGLVLLAISPNYFPDEKLSQAIRELRNIPSVRSVYRNLSELELLIAKAVRRASPQVIPLEWIEQLKRSVSEATE